MKIMTALHDESLQMESESSDCEESEDSSDPDTPADDENSETEESQCIDMPPEVVCRRMQCMAHTMQLVIKKAYTHYKVLIDKARHVVFKIRKSSIATQMLIAKCGKTVISDKCTRWNSTYFMAKRLIEIKSSVTEVLGSIMVDSLLVNEWEGLDEMTGLLGPFATQTDLLQTACHFHQS
jgi:hypothetical protein